MQLVTKPRHITTEELKEAEEKQRTKNTNEERGFTYMYNDYMGLCTNIGTATTVTILHRHVPALQSCRLECRVGNRLEQTERGYLCSEETAAGRTQLLTHH